MRALLFVKRLVKWKKRQIDRSRKDQVYLIRFGSKIHPVENFEPAWRRRVRARGEGRERIEASSEYAQAQQISDFSEAASSVLNLVLKYWTMWFGKGAVWRKKKKKKCVISSVTSSHSKNELLYTTATLANYKRASFPITWNPCLQTTYFVSPRR